MSSVTTTVEVVDTTTSPTSSLPIIDFSPFFSGKPEEKLETGKQMVKVLREVGFMYIINHGIEQKEIDDIFEWSKKFFELSDEQKSKCPHPPNGAHHRGWSALGKEKVVQMVFDEKEISNLRKHPDVKESFDVGKEDGYYCNFWPEDTDIPGFKAGCQNYYNKATLTSKYFLRALALGMDLNEDFFLNYHIDSENQLRLLHYPPTKEQDLRNGSTERIAAHTDFGTMTLLLQDSCGGLEVEDPYHKGVFIPAPYVPGALVVNTGDFLMRWSNNALKSTLHRVRAPPIISETGYSKVRYSIPFFISADRTKTIDCLPGTYSEENPKKYEPINALEYLSMRLNATY
ncbi:hypothetical protein PACTADRAFT_66530 [Pachysolen tannophilus NRRL Y-2460]|uniref:Fe2OG dioxygenase domain-containing protein n=1 Tax=Pachysolen tannophilus NRRL Y-2460 TaxID=669874 RepID=A0A1E4U0E1_PACTA|nr:hypothetical protein PACTADRAFT_66530 [Pachysolen tannophilus NRRL Y-2460]